MTGHRIHLADIVRTVLAVIALVGLVFTLRGDAVRVFAYFGYPKPVLFLIGIGADPDIGLVYTAIGGQAELADLLIQHGAKVDARRGGDTGRTALMEAAARGHLETVMLLVRKRADVELPLHNGWTALTVATMEGQPQVVEFLLKSGARIDVRDRDGKTPCDIAAERKLTSITEILSRYGACNAK